MWPALLVLLLSTTALTPVRGVQELPADCKNVVDAAALSSALSGNGNNELTFCLQQCVPQPFSARFLPSRSSIEHKTVPSVHSWPVRLQESARQRCASCDNSRVHSVSSEPQGAVASKAIIDGSEHIDLERSVGHGCGWNIVCGSRVRDFYARIAIAEPSYFASDVQ